MATETAIVADSPEPPPPLALPEEHMDPLQRLDAIMAQTTDWQHLRATLAKKSPFVRNTICTALNGVMAQSFQNVAGQIEALRKIKAELQEMLKDEDVAALHHLMRTIIHPSDTRALQREADGIDQDLKDLRLAFENGDLKSLQSRADCVKNKAKRFRDKFEELHLKLDRWKCKLEELCQKCADGAARSDTLRAETEARRDWWVWLLMVVQYLVAGAFGVLTVEAGAVAIGPVAAQWSTNSQALAAAYSALSMAKAFAASKSAAAATAAAQATAAAAAAKATATSAAAVQASGSGVAGAAVAATTGATAAAATAVAGVGAPAATFMGSEMLGGVAVSLGLLPTPAAPVGIVLGVGAAVSAAAVVLWHCMQPAAAAEISATAAQLAADASAAAAAAAAAEQAVAALSSAAASVTDAAGTVASLTSATSLHSIFASLSTGLMSTSFAPLITCAGLFLALALLGYVGRDLVKRLLAELFAAEIQQHEKAKDEFQRMKQVVGEAAEKLKTAYMYEKNGALGQSLDLVVEVAEEIASNAEDAQTMNAKMVSLKKKVDKLWSTYQRVPEAISELVVSLRNLDEGPRSLEPPARIPIAVPARSTEDTLALISSPYY